MVVSPDLNVLVLQGGGALGAYQAGAVQALAQQAIAPDWITGISIGAVNGALIAGNPPERRAERLTTFWERCADGLGGTPWGVGILALQQFSDIAGTVVMARGVPGFFNTRVPPPMFQTRGTDAAISYYDTAPLRDTLLELCDFEWMNAHGPRISLGAVEVDTGNLVFFDSAKMTITPEHVMASGALPPAFAPVRIGRKSYWDGGLVSNTPLQFILQEAGDVPLCIFQFDLFSALGAVPRDMSEVAARDKDIRYSSRTRMNTDLFQTRHDTAAAAQRLRGRLPPEWRDDADLAELCGMGPPASVTLLHLIHRPDIIDSGIKDFDFSRAAMLRHWAEGERDVRHALAHPEWTGRPRDHQGIAIYDFGGPKPGRRPSRRVRF